MAEYTRAAHLAATAFEVDGFLEELDATIQAVGGCAGQAEFLRERLEIWAPNGIRLQVDRACLDAYLRSLRRG